MGEVVSSRSFPYKHRPASSRRESRAPRPTGFTSGWSSRVDLGERGWGRGLCEAAQESRRGDRGGWTWGKADGVGGYARRRKNHVGVIEESGPGRKCCGRKDICGFKGGRRRLVAGEREEARPVG
jgi:hypothetical protein